MDARPFNDFHKPGITQFLDTFFPGYKPPTRQTIVKKLKLNYTAYLKKLKDILKRVPMIALTTDLWKNKGLTYFICLTAHFFDEEFNYFSVIIGFRTIFGRHLSNRIYNFIKAELDYLEIPLENIVSITTDGGADIKSAINKFKSIKRISCMAHNLNLIIKNGLKLWNNYK